MKSTTFVSALAFAALFAATAPAAGQADTSDIAKTWRGVIHASNNQPIPVKLKITKAWVGDEAGTIQWGSPYQCSSQLQYATIDKGVWSLTPHKSNGGFCDNAEGGEVQLKYIAGQTLSYKLLAPKDRKLLQETTLTADPKP